MIAAGASLYSTVPTNLPALQEQRGTEEQRTGNHNDAAESPAARPENGHGSRLLVRNLTRSAQSSSGGVRVPIPR